MKSVQYTIIGYGNKEVPDVKDLIVLKTTNLEEAKKMKLEVFRAYLSLEDKNSKDVFVCEGECIYLNVDEGYESTWFVAVLEHHFVTEEFKKEIFYFYDDYFVQYRNKAIDNQRFEKFVELFEDYRQKEKEIVKNYVSNWFQKEKIRELL